MLTEYYFRILKRKKTQSELTLQKEKHMNDYNVRLSDEL